MNSKRTNKVNLECVWIFLFSRICPTPLIFIPEKILGIFHFNPEESCPSESDPDRFTHVFIRVEKIFSRNFGFNFRFVGFQNSNFSNPKDLFLCFHSENVIHKFSKISKFFIFLYFYRDVRWSIWHRPCDKDIWLM